MRSITLAFAVLAFGSVVGPARADHDVNEFLSLHDTAAGKELTELEISALASGLMEANAYLTTIRKEAPIYCQPDRLSLTSPQLVDMLRRAVDETPKLGTTDIAFATVAVMIRTFPCPDKEKVPTRPEKH